MKRRLYIVTKRTVMQGEKVVGVYDSPVDALLHHGVIEAWNNGLAGAHILDGPWWWWFRGKRFLAARLREEYGYLDWGDEGEDPAPVP